MKSSIQILSALHGDAFILNLWSGDKQGVIVVDSGPYNLGRRISNQIKDIECIDLLVITHFDDDHIGGIIKYVQEVAIDKTKWNIRRMWVNNSKNYPLALETHLSLQQATTLADALDTINVRYPDFIWKPYVSAGCEIDLEFAKIEVVSPPIAFEKEMIKRLADEQVLLADEGNAVNPTEMIALEILANNPNREPNLVNYNELANATSIAFILESEDLRVLMLGDSYPNNIENYLRKKYSENNKLKVDYVKVSHHGSLVNSSTSLYNILDCNNFIISTNGKKHGHPDREAIAKIVCREHRSAETIHIFLNYPKDNYQQFICEGEEERFNFQVHYGVDRLPL